MVVLAAVLLAPAGETGAAPQAASLPAATVKAREHFFGAGNVDSEGRLRRDRVILSWFSVASLAMAIDGHVVLLDTYIHKGESQPGYVPTTTDELVDLRPEVVFIGHGHFDHANTAGQVVARTGASLVGTPEHCDQTKEQAASYAGRAVAVRCVATVDRGSAPGAQVRSLRPLGERVAISVFKHVHSAAEPPDGEGHETSLTSGPLADPSLILLHPPGPSALPGLNPAGDEGSSLLYQFRIGAFSLVWHDSAGPLREEAPRVFDRLRELPATDVEFGAVLGFNDPTNGMRDPVDYVTTLRPELFYPVHHDFIAEYGGSKILEGVFRRELARRPRIRTDIQWLYDPYDYLRPRLATFDVDNPRFANSGCLARRAPIGPSNIGRIRLNLTGRTLLRRVAPRPILRANRRWRWCVKRSRGSVTAVFNRGGRTELVVTTATAHGNRRLRPGSRLSLLRRAYPSRRRVLRGVYRGSSSSPRLIGVRRGRVRYFAVASPRLLRHPRLLREYLKRAD